MPKLIPSQKDMEEANSQPIRAARPPAPNFIKSDPRPKRAQPGLLETMESTPKPARCGTTVKPAKQDPPKPVESGLRPANDRITAAPAQMGFGSVVSTQEKRNPQAEHTQTEPSRPAKLLHMHIAKLAKVPHALKPTEPLKASSIPKHIKKEPSPTPSLFSDSSESSESSDWGNSQPIFEVLAPRIGGSSDRAIVLEDTPPPKTPEKKRVMFSNKLGISNIPDNKRPQRIPTNPQPRRRQAASSTLPEINTLVKTDMRDRFQEILRFAAMSHTKKTAMEDREDPPTPAEHGRLFEQLVKNGIVSNESQPGKPPDDPDNTLVNEGDEGDGYPNDSDSDSSDEDSLDSGTWQSDGDSDRGDMEDWREALPDYHAQTFAVLEQIAKVRSLIGRFMCPGLTF